ncbi:hypothetical protein D3C83_222470 [compost metagenome]
MIVVGDLFLANLERGHHRQNDGQVFCSGTLPAFLFAAEQQRMNLVAMRDF